MSVYRLLRKQVSLRLLVACAVIALLWAGTHSSVAVARLPVGVGQSRWAISSYRGLLSVTRTQDYPAARSLELTVRRATARDAGACDSSLWDCSYAGFSVTEGDVWVDLPQAESVPRRWHSVVLPYWLIASLVALSPLRRACLAMRAVRRAARDQCPDCGYRLGGGAVCQACVARAALIGGSPRARLVHPI